LVVGAICKDGLVLISEKNCGFQNKNFLNTENIFPINKTTAIGASGKCGDIHYLIGRTRYDDTTHREFFSESLTGPLLVARISALMHMHTVYWHLRPFGCSGIIGTISDFSPEIYVIFQTGLFIKCYGTAIGNQSEMTKISLENILAKFHTCRKNIEVISKSIKKMNPKLNVQTLEIFCFSKEKPIFSKPISYNILTENRRISNFFQF